MLARRTSSRSRSTAISRPYLREISLKRDKAFPADQYPFIIPAVKNLGSLSFDANISFIVGENGTGKSTLLEAIAVALGLNAEGGSRNFNFSSRASHSQLWQHLRIVRSWSRPRDQFFLRAESFFNVATEIESLDADPGPPRLIDAYGGISLHEQSHGESFFALLMNRFRGRGLYLLDEPEAALSPMRQVKMLARIRELISLDSQFIIATHSPILLAYPNALIWNLDETGYHQTPYLETEHYRVMKAFLDNPEEAVRLAFTSHELDPRS
jgi:predicted ATPase